MKSCLKSNSTERLLFYWGLAALPLGALLYGLYIWLIYPVMPFHGCIFDRLIGLYCPGCGGSRAFYSLLRGDLILSIQYHPLVIYAVLIYVVFMMSQLLSVLSRGRIKGIRFRSRYLYVALIIIVVNCLVRNYLRLRHGVTL